MLAPGRFAGGVFCFVRVSFRPLGIYMKFLLFLIPEIVIFAGFRAVLVLKFLYMEKLVDLLPEMGKMGIRMASFFV